MVLSMDRQRGVLPPVPLDSMVDRWVRRYPSFECRPRCTLGAGEDDSIPVSHRSCERRVDVFVSTLGIATAPISTGVVVPHAVSASIVGVPSMGVSHGYTPSRERAVRRFFCPGVSRTRRSFRALGYTDDTRSGCSSVPNWCGRSGRCNATSKSARRCRVLSYPTVRRFRSKYRALSSVKVIAGRFSPLAPPQAAFPDAFPTTAQ